jgi:hypothetical protein
VFSRFLRVLKGGPAAPGPVKKGKGASFAPSSFVLRFCASVSLIPPAHFRTLRGPRVHALSSLEVGAAAWRWHHYCGWGLPFVRRWSEKHSSPMSQKAPALGCLLCVGERLLFIEDPRSSERPSEERLAAREEGTGKKKDGGARFLFVFFLGPGRGRQGFFFLLTRGAQFAASLLFCFVLLGGSVCLVGIILDAFYPFPIFCFLLPYPSTLSPPPPSLSLACFLCRFLDRVDDVPPLALSSPKPICFCLCFLAMLFFNVVCFIDAKKSERILSASAKPPDVLHTRVVSRTHKKTTSQRNHQSICLPCTLPCAFSTLFAGRQHCSIALPCTARRP